MKLQRNNIFHFLGGLAIAMWLPVLGMSLGTTAIAVLAIGVGKEIYDYFHKEYIASIHDADSVIGGGVLGIMWWYVLLLLDPTFQIPLIFSI